MLERIRRTVNELTASEERLRRFVGDASHELRTPTAAVSAYAQLFNHGIASRPEELSRVMTGIERESARMAQLIEDLLVLAKLDEHRPLASDPIELVGLVLESVDTARAVAPTWPIHVRADEALEIMGDRSALRQVVDNLLSNVRSHTPDGTTATVTVERRGKDAIVQVSDDGPGFTTEQSAHLFERFFRVDASRARGNGGGSGLGLSIVAAIVAAHGGRVEARPGPSGGATFTVRLPASKSDLRDDAEPIIATYDA
jgi:two-component system OmpR family sensor kinase